MRALLQFALCLALPSCYLSHELGDDGGAVDLGHAAIDLGRADATASPDLGIVFPDSGACTPRATNGDAIRRTCEPDRVTCPDGYSCDAHEGAVVQFLCEIECPTGCECPAETSCGTFVDKAGSHRYCQPMPILI